MRRINCFLAIVSFLMLFSIPLYSMNPIPADATAYAGPDDNVCEGSSYDIMLSTASNYASLFWTSSGNGTFNDATILHPIYTPGVGEIGPVTLTLTAYAIMPGANASDDMILTIYDGPEANFTVSPADTAYVGEVVTFTGMASTPIVTWDWDLGDGNIAFSQVVSHTYIFPGQFEVQLIVMNTDGCLDTVIHDITIIDPIFDFTMNPSPCCENQSVAFHAFGGIGPGVYQWDFGDGNTATGQDVTHTYTMVGIYNVELTFGPELIQHSMQVIEGAYACAGPDDTICSNESFTLMWAMAFNEISRYWTSSGDGTFDDTTLVNPTYFPGPGDISNGTVDLIITAYSVLLCDSTDSMTLTIDPGPLVDAGADTSSCEGAPVMLSGYAEGQTSITWATAGDGTFDNPNILNASYTAGINDTINGSVVLSLTAFATVPCVTDESDSLLLTFVTSSTADAGDDGVICGNSSYILNGSATNYTTVLWTSSGDGNFDDPTLLNAEYTAGTGDINNGIVTLSLSAGATEPCSDAVDDMLLSVAPPPIANAGDDDGICQGEDYSLSGTASDYNEISWSTGGDGNFDDPNILDPIYTPGPTDINNREATLTLTATAIAPCTLGMMDGMTLGIDPEVGNPTTPAGPILVDSYMTPISNYQIEETPEAGGYKWSMSPSDAGDVAGDSTLGVVSWNAAYHGFAYVRVTAYNSCSEQNSDSLLIEVTTSVGLNEMNTNDQQLKIIPNPNNGNFRIELENMQGDAELHIYDCYGKVVLQPSITANENELNINLGHMAKGIYFLKLITKDAYITDRIVVR